MSKTSFKTVDAGRLLSQGIEPFPEIRRRLASLKPKEGLAVACPFLPSPLIEKLQSENFTARVEHQPNGSWLVYFWKEE